MNEEQDVEVADNPDESRYEARIGGALAGVQQYKRAPNVIAVLHTEVQPEFEGRGIGGTLARTALESAREAGDEVMPICPFFAEYLRTHPEYHSLVYEKKSDANN